MSTFWGNSNIWPATMDTLKSSIKNHSLKIQVGTLVTVVLFVIVTAWTGGMNYSSVQASASSVNQISTKVGGVTNRMDEVEKQQAIMDLKIAFLEEKIDGMSEDVKDIKSKVDDMHIIFAQIGATLEK